MVSKTEFLFSREKEESRVARVLKVTSLAVRSHK